MMSKKEEKKKDTNKKEKKKKEKSKDSKLKTVVLHYIIPFIVSIIGALLLSLPWAVAYGYFKFNYGFLTLLIPIGAFYGYKISKGKWNAFSYIAIIVASILALAISSGIMIPIFTNLYMKEPIDIIGFYNSEVNTKFLTINYGIAAAFELIMLAYIFVIMKLQMNRGSKNICITNNVSYDIDDLQFHDTYKEIFKKYKATSQERAITKAQVFEELEDRSSDITREFKILKNVGYIKRVGNRYFYTGISKINKSAQLIDRYLLFFLVICILVTIGIIYGNTHKFIHKFSDANVTFLMKSNWIEDNDFTNKLKKESASFTSALYSNSLGEDGSYEIIDEVEEVKPTETYYYLINKKYENVSDEYLSSVGTKEKASMMDVSVKVNYENENSFESYENMKETLYTYMMNGEKLIGEIDFSEFESKQGYKVYCIDYDEVLAENFYYRRMEYFIYTENKMGYVSVSVQNFDRYDDMKKDVLFLIDSFKFK
jgi:hypothetical protein